MRRRGEIGIEGVLLQLFVVGFLVIILLIASQRLHGNNEYVQEMHATNAAHVITAMLASKDGSITASTVTPDAMVTDLSETTVSVVKQRPRQADAGGTTRRFVTSQDTEIIDAESRNRIVVWKRTGNSLTLEGVSTNDACPRLGERVDWQKVRIEAEGEVLAMVSDAVAAATRGFTLPQLLTEQAPDTDFTIIARVGETNQVRSTSEAPSVRIRCVAEQELRLSPVTVIETGEEIQGTNTLEMTMRESDLEHYPEILRVALASAWRP